MITPLFGVSNLDLSHGPVLWIIEAESGDNSIDVGLDEIKLGLRDTVSDVRVRNLEGLDTLDANGDYLIIIGHGIPRGLKLMGR